MYVYIYMYAVAGCLFFKFLYYLYGNEAKFHFGLGAVHSMKEHFYYSCMYYLLHLLPL